MHRLILGCVLVLVLAVPSLAEDPPAPAKAAGVDTPITLEAKDASAAELIDQIARAAGLNVIVSPDIVKARVRASFEALPARAALEQVAEAAGGALVEEAHGIFRIVTKDKLRIEHDYYRFQHLPKAASAGDDALPRALDALRRVLPKGDGLRYVAAEHAVILSARSDRMKGWRVLLHALDRPASAKAEATTGARPQDAIATYEQMLRDCQTETAAKYFVERIAILRSALR